LQQGIYLKCDINTNMCNVEGNAAEGHRQSNAIILLTVSSTPQYGHFDCHY